MKNIHSIVKSGRKFILESVKLSYMDKILTEFGLTKTMLSNKQIKELRKIGFKENDDPDVDKMHKYLSTLSRDL